MHRVVAVLDDLMFTVKIMDAAKRAGLQLECVKTEAAALDKARTDPALVIVDLNYSGVDVVRLITALKTDPQIQSVPLIGYVSHVQVELKAAAQQAGCDVVLARSAFVQNLPELLARYAEASRA